jgi:protease-4
MAADRVYAQPTSVVGSIGVIARLPQASALAEKIGYSELVFKSGEMKDLANPLRAMTEPERAVCQGLVLALYERFVAAVLAGRPAFKTAADLQPVADGRVFTAAQAQELKLIDDVAYLPDVIAKAKAAAGLRTAAVVTYGRGPAPDATIYSAGGGAPPVGVGARGGSGQVNLVNLDLSALVARLQPGFYYLWQP